MKKIKVMVIDDSKFIRVLFAGLLSNRDDMEVVETSEDPDDARDKIKALAPDVIVLDVNLRKMDSINFLEHLMAEDKLPVIMAASADLEDVELAVKALEAGAVEYIMKPTNIDDYRNISEFAKNLEEKIKIAVNCNINATIAYRTQNLKSTHKPPEVKHRFAKGSIIAMGAATGGVEAIRQILVRMPENSPPIVVAQNLPEGFSQMFASRLNNISMVDVKEAKHGDKLKPGCAYIIPGDKHMKVSLKGNGYELSHIKGRGLSVDELFKSLSAAAGNNAVGVILSGVNNDGAAGLLKMKKAGSPTISQSPDSCIASQMPKAAIKKGAVTEELPVHKIAERVCRLCEG